MTKHNDAANLEANNEGDGMGEFLAIFGEMDTSVPFAEEWNRTLTDLVKSSQGVVSGWVFKSNLEYLTESFDSYKRSPLAKYCTFKNFHQLEEDCELVTFNNVYRKLIDEAFYSEGASLSTAELKSDLRKMIDVALDDVEIEFLFMQLMKRWKEWKNSDAWDFFKQETTKSWTDFRSEYERDPDADVFEVIDRQIDVRGLMVEKQNAWFDEDSKKHMLIHEEFKI